MGSVTGFFKKVVKLTNEASASAMSKSVEVTSAGTSSASSQLYSQQALSSNAVTTGTTNTNTNQGLRRIDSGPAQPQLAKFPLTMFGKIITQFLAKDFNDTK